MSDYDFLIGKTVASVTETIWGDELIVRFTDGTGVHLEAHSYEDADLSVDELDAAGLEKAEADERAAREERERREAAERARNAEVRRMRESLPKAEFERWMDEHRPGWRWQYAIVADMQKSFARQLNSPLFDK